MYPLNMEQGNEGNHPFFIPAPAYKSQIYYMHSKASCCPLFCLISA